MKLFIRLVKDPEELGKPEEMLLEFLHDPSKTGVRYSARFIKSLCWNFANDEDLQMIAAALQDEIDQHINAITDDED